MATAALLLVVTSLAVASAPFTGPRSQICLNGDWLRHQGGDAVRAPEGEWETVRVPEDPASAATGSAWFRLDFRIPEEMSGEGQRLLLRFVRVRHYARVFVNGVLCGENWGQRAPFEVDVTSAARPGLPNRVEVWVHCASAEHVMPGRTVTDQQARHRLAPLIGYREQATIAEDVYLIARPDLHISDVLVMPSVREKSLRVRLTVANDSARPREMTVANRVYLGAREALVLPSHALALEAGASAVVTISAPWPDAQLWGYPPYGEPVLYHAETRLLGTDGDEVDRLVTRFGFREIWTEGDRILLNGRELRLMGYWGPEASGPSAWRLRMAAVRSAGCNTIHSHAEQKDPAFYELADELGLLVWDANYCGGPLGSTESEHMSQDSFPEVVAELARQYPLWARAVANHPSVVVVMAACLLNQADTDRLAALFHQMDSTRLIQRAGAATPPLQVAAYSSHFQMDGPDPLADIKSSHEQARTLRRWQGASVPLVNQEVWYRWDWSRPESTPTPEDFARATRRAIEFFGDEGVSGFILYGQQAFEDQPLLDGPISWPSRSGTGQHAQNTVTGGLAWGPREFVNLHDPGRPAVTPRPVAAAMREASRRYLGHEVPPVTLTRPEVIVTVTSGGEPVADAYVLAVLLEGAPVPPAAVRTDRDGRAWFSLREPGRYRFLCRGGRDWQSVELEAPLQPLDLSNGGLGPILRVSLPLADGDGDP